MSEPPGPESDKLSRRQVWSTMLGAAGTAYVCTLGYPVVRYLGEASRVAAEDPGAPEEVLLEAAAETPRGSSALFYIGAEPCLLIHFEDDTWAAYSALCTHMNCVVQYQPERDRILCPCHEGVFEPRTGRNLEGPPPTPLRKYRVVVHGIDVRVSKEG
jgi:cytochrome b6-f complex iron-sulfur subunit